MSDAFELTQELRDEFCSEADEHLVAVRRGLEGLEPGLASGRPDAAIVESLFRSFHSFKGNAAIVGLAAGEAVAHACEDYLRLLRDGTALPTRAALDTIAAAARSLERIVVDFRERRPAAPHEGVLASVRAVCVEAAAASAPAPATPADDDDAHSPFLAPSHLVRVDLKRLDDLMRIVGELIIRRSRLEIQLERLSEAAARESELYGAREASLALGRSVRELGSAVMRVRMIPVAEIFGRMPFVVKDLAREHDKRIRLAVTGQETAIDKFMIERLKDPLLHLVRNAFSHGIETAAERAAAHKPEEAVIELSARTAGDSVVIVVRDDGRGIDPAAIVRRARRLGLKSSERPGAAEILALLCEPGFTTRDDADRASGRGVGMAVVAATVRELGGAISLDSAPGRGTAFTLRIPLTLAIVDSFIVTAGGQTYAIPQGSVSAVLEAAESEVQTVNGVEALPFEGGLLPVVRLARVFGLGGAAPPRMRVLVLQSERGRAGLAVDRVKGRQEIVVHALGDPLTRAPGVSGATELGDGVPVMILDAAALMGDHLRTGAAL